MSANFEFFGQCVNEDIILIRSYEKIDRLLDEAENCYWKEPVTCARLLQEIAEEVCRIYNHYYEIGVSEQANLHEYLCYGDDEEHNRNVSRFFSAVRNEQRNFLNEIRVLGNDCIYLEEHPEELAKSGDQIPIDVRRMMITMMEILKEMCTIVNKRDDIEDEFFFEKLIPKEEESILTVPKESFWNRFHKKK